jgi:hypothetical protein
VIPLINMGSLPDQPNQTMAGPFHIPLHLTEYKNKNKNKK